MLLAFFGLILYPILRADRPYYDDLKRALFGRAGWDSNGRPLATLLMRALQFYDHAMVDLSPLTQIGGVALIALAGTGLARRYVNASPWLAALLVFPLGAQPFLLANLAYRFDALGMGLAILLAAWPLWRPLAGRRAWWLGVLALFGSLALYQPAINVYLVLALVECVILQLAVAPAPVLLRNGAWRLAQVVTAMVLYELLVGIHINGWVKQQAQPIRSWQELPLLAHNLEIFGRFIADAFNGHWQAVFGPVLAALALVPTWIGMRYASQQQAGRWRWKTLAWYAVAWLLPLAGVVLAFGPMLLLRQPEMEPRVLMGVGAWICGALLVAFRAARTYGWSERWIVTSAGLLVLGMVVVASACGNAMKAQQDYEQRIAGWLTYDVASLARTHPIRHLIVGGSVGMAPLTAHAVSQIPLMRSLVPVYLDGHDPFVARGFLAYFLPALVDTHYPGNDAIWSDGASLKARICGLTPLTIRPDYQLFLVGNVVVARFAHGYPATCVTDKPGADADGLGQGAG